MTDEKKTKKNNYFEEGMKFRDEINQRLKQKDYLLTILQTGEKVFSGDDPKRMVDPERFYKVCSLDEIHETINFMKQPFYHHPDLEDGMSERKKNKIPLEEKKWGIYYEIEITPLTKEKENNSSKILSQGFYRVGEIYLREDISVL